MMIPSNLQLSTRDSKESPIRMWWLSRCIIIFLYSTDSLAKEHLLRLHQLNFHQPECRPSKPLRLEDHV